MDIYEKQKYANSLAFLTADEFTAKKAVLETLCHLLERKNINWALAMSSSLFFRGIVDDFNDFDILIGINDVSKFELVFKEIGEINDHTVQKVVFSSPYYKEARCGEIHFDLIGDMTVNTFFKSYRYVLEKQDIEYVALDGGLMIPIVPVEANYLLYAMMVGWQTRRSYKVNLCIKYLEAKGIKHRDVWERINDIEDCLPEDVIRQMQLLG